MSSTRARLVMLGLSAFAVRLAVVAATNGYRPIHDDASYTRVAQSLLTLGRYPGHHLPGGGWQVSAYRPPGWPATLWGTWHLLGEDVVAARILTAALGATVVVLVAVFAGQLFGRRVATAAGVLAAISPLAIAVNVSLESEALFTALVAGAACLAMAARRGGGWAPVAGLGALAGLAALTRTNGLVLTPLLALLAVPPGLRWRPRIVHFVVPVVLAALVITPWTLRNSAELNAFVPVSTETGNTLAGMYNSVSMRSGVRWLEPKRTGAYRAVYRRYGASAAGDRALTHAVVGWVARHPAALLRVPLANGGRLLGLTGGPGWASFSLWTMSLSGAGAGVVWAGVLLVTLLAAAGAWLSRGRGVPAAVWLLLAGLFLPAAFVNGELRLGAPAQLVLLPLAGLALACALPAVQEGFMAARRPLGGR